MHNKINNTIQIPCQVFFIFFSKISKNWHITFQVGDVLPARIRACAARPGLAKCGGAKPCRGRKPEHDFVEPEPPKGGEALTVCYVL